MKDTFLCTLFHRYRSFRKRNFISKLWFGKNLSDIAKHIYFKSNTIVAFLRFFLAYLFFYFMCKNHGVVGRRKMKEALEYIRDNARKVVGCYQDRRTRSGVEKGRAWARPDPFSSAFIHSFRSVICRLVADSLFLRNILRFMYYNHSIVLIFFVKG